MERVFFYLHLYAAGPAKIPFSIPRLTYGTDPQRWPAVRQQSRRDEFSSIPASLDLTIEIDNIFTIRRHSTAREQAEVVQHSRELCAGFRHGVARSKTEGEQ
jgi:hypothetical protein